MLNSNEKDIIIRFMQNLDKYENEKMLLIWNDGSQIEAYFDTCFEDDNDLDEKDERYEEFMSFAFTKISAKGRLPVYITADNGFLLSYRNFPDIIMAGQEKIN